MTKKTCELNDPVFDTLPKFNKDEIQRLLDLACHGDVAVRDELIFQLLSVCKVILLRRLHQNPSLKRHIEDVVSILTLKTCQWVSSLGEQDWKQTPTYSYYWSVVVNELNDFNTADTNPNISGNRARQQYLAGNEPPVRVRLTDDLLQTNPTSMLEFEDILLTLAETDCEREVIIQRFQGYTTTEIAENLGVSRKVLRRMQKTLEERYNNL